jgi:hypothetical protein
MVKASLFLVLATAGAVLVGCHGWRDLDDDDIVFEAQELAPLSGGCVVRGSVRNETGHTARIFIAWRAEDDDDDVIGTAEVELRDVPRDASRSYESTRFREFDGDRLRCDEIHRLKRDVFVTRE